MAQGQAVPAYPHVAQTRTERSRITQIGARRGAPEMLVQPPAHLTGLHNSNPGWPSMPHPAGACHQDC